MNIYHPNSGSFVNIVIRMANGSGTGTVTNPRCGDLPISLTVAPSGSVSGTMKFTAATRCDSGHKAKVSGQVEGKGMRLEMQATMSTEHGGGKLRLRTAP